MTTQPQKKPPTTLCMHGDWQWFITCLTSSHFPVPVFPRTPYPRTVHCSSGFHHMFPQVRRCRCSFDPCEISSQFHRLKPSEESKSLSTAVLAVDSRLEIDNALLRQEKQLWAESGQSLIKTTRCSRWAANPLHTLPWWSRHGPYCCPRSFRQILYKADRCKSKQSGNSRSISLRHKIVIVILYWRNISNHFTSQK